eukprot:CAMPEP_0180167360 /NCGR_PEP_ID=MMETSP0986-20121125/32084_1 /TAXON_ID=697907 /ORGANISM="non described non described, Strain CCMP2293" /LENGTH=101 /DNA_ID=CAMNT_0022118643 /DNA_START=99 /DNA_END=401 /DNA_ORIENTATION=+
MAPLPPIPGEGNFRGDPAPPSLPTPLSPFPLASFREGAFPEGAFPPRAVSLLAVSFPAFPKGEARLPPPPSIAEGSPEAATLPLLLGDSFSTGRESAERFP